jgi:hypothetical protein
MARDPHLKVMVIEPPKDIWFVKGRTFRIPQTTVKQDLVLRSVVIKNSGWRAYAEFR